MNLKNVSHQMFEEIRVKGYSHVILKRELKLELWERETDIVLGISRPSALVCPSELEIDICRQAFFGEIPLKEVNGQSYIWSKRKCFMATPREYVYETSNANMAPNH